MSLPPPTDQMVRQVREPAESGGSATGADAAAPALPAVLPARSYRRRRVLADGVLPLGLYALNRAVQLVLVVLLEKPDTTLVKRLTSWDADFFIRVARDGYDHAYQYDPAGHLIGNTLAFFPGYPILVRLIALPGLPYPVAAVVASLLAGGAAVVLLHLLASRLWSRRTGYVLAALFCAQPMAIVLSMGYSEALFCALVLAMLLAAHHRSWLLAGLFGVLAGLTRTTGLAAALALACYAGYRVWVDRRQPGAPRARPLVAGLLALAAVPAYWLWVGLRVGEPDAWFVEQKDGWGTAIDGGAATLKFLFNTFRAGNGFVEFATAFIILGTGVGVAAALLGRVWGPFALYGLLAYGTVVGSSGYFNSRPRLLLPVLVALVPVGCALARARTRVLVPALAGLSVLGCWFGAYMITVWPYTI